MAVKRKPQKNPRPKRKTPEQLEDLIAKYFQQQDDAGLPYTIMGLARGLDMTREVLLRYQRAVGYSEQVIDAKNKVREKVEERLLAGKGSTAGAIFWLKNNAGWVDKQEVGVSGDLKVSIYIPENGRK